MDEEEGSFEKQINTNLSSSYHLTRQSIHAIRKSSKPYIFNICSTASITPYLNGGSYCISKYAQMGFTKVLREELKEDKIKVSARSTWCNIDQLMGWHRTAKRSF